MSRRRRGGSPGASLTPDARRTLNRAGLSRRSFLKQSGVLIVGFGAIAGTDVPAYVPPQEMSGPGNARLDSWIAVAADGRVTAYTGKCELGQGLYTAQMQLVAEELGVPLDRVTLIQCDTGVTPDQGTTSGAQSHPANFNHANLALAAATAREALVRLASARLAVPIDRLIAQNGLVTDGADRAKAVSYGELVGGKTFDLPLDSKATRRHPRDWTVLGTPTPRVDLPAMATGEFEFVHNVRVPGMLHGAVVRPPTVGASLVSIDERSVGDMPGVIRVVAKNNFVGVVAEKPWQAMQAAAKLRVDWTKGTSLPAQRELYHYIRSRPARRDSVLVDSGDVDARLKSAARVIKATYHYPYQMHGSLGSSCAVADVGDGKTTLWSATQAVYPMRSTAAMLLGLPPEQVRVIFRTGSGCYGLNGADTVTYDAALLSQAVGRPVRVQLSRADEMAWENYGMAYVIDQRVALDADGRIVAWDYEAWNPTRGSRPGTGRPGNVVTGFLAGFEPAPFAPRAPERAAAFANRSNAAPSYVTGCVGGRCEGTGSISSERVLSHAVESPFWTGPLRSPSRLQNTLAHECFMDEVAASVKADPIVYRLRHLRDPRMREVLEKAARTANWDARPSPAPGRRPTGIARGRGVSCVLYEGDNGYCAIVAEVEVNQDTGDVTVTRCIVALDCGPVSNPDGARNQIEGGVIQGISRTLREEVTWDERVTSVNWTTYRPWYLGDAVPIIESVFVDRHDVEACGAGETSITVTAAAIGNAIFDATGARLREIPFTSQRLKKALTVAG
jgi:CO/xanthine dehydrogenase Mo-binding subunit